jgi:ferredoxin
MTYVVTEDCVDCKYTDCAAVCPVEAFHELPDRLYINADTCIDCDACVPECPVEAIFSDAALPEHLQGWLELNVNEAPNYPIISGKIPALYGPTCKGNPEQ